ncbi:MAG: 16S rRNA (adenine(1518)-N(6)/adenine(1519)-N(6))-dimethyltransferase RsmA [Fibrobacterota bacterium]
MKKTEYPPVLKKFGQHFLTDPGILESLCGLIKNPEDFPVLEIGPGRGALTGFLLDRFGKLTAVEKDRELTRLLITEFGGSEGFKVINKDFLEFDINSFSDGRFIAVGNIPYNITGPILLKLAAAREKVFSAYLMVQKEVGERLAASAGSRAYGFITAFIKSFADVRILKKVKKGSFLPPPKVDSVFIEVDFKKNTNIDYVNTDAYREFISAAFSQRRKKAVKVLAAVYGDRVHSVFEKQGLHDNTRAEDISPTTFRDIFSDL